MSCGNDGQWKAWKAKSRLPTLPTALVKPAKAAAFPHSPSFDDCPLYKEDKQGRPYGRAENRQRGGWAKINCRSGPKSVAKATIARVDAGEGLDA
jgi:hypothetical protein